MCKEMGHGKGRGGLTGGWCHRKRQQRRRKRSRSREHAVGTEAKRKWGLII